MIKVKELIGDLVRATLANELADTTLSDNQFFINYKRIINSALVLTIAIVHFNVKILFSNM